MDKRLDLGAKPPLLNFVKYLPPPPPGNGLHSLTLNLGFFGSLDPKRYHLKGLGHGILGNFSTDQMVIELTKISK